MKTSRNLYVQYGCQWCAPTEWLNFDASPTLKLERLPVVGRFVRKNDRMFPYNVEPGDIVRGLGLPDGCAKGVYASHVLEHLTLQDAHIALKNTFRMMAPDGIFRLVVPDLQWRAREYLQMAADGDVNAAAKFMRKTRLGRETNEHSLIEKLSRLFGKRARHWMWDELAMREALLNTGFDRIRRCKIGGSEDHMFDLVEDAGRFFDGEFAEVAYEARKPPRSLSG